MTGGGEWKTRKHEADDVANEILTSDVTRGAPSGTNGVAITEVACSKPNCAASKCLGTGLWLVTFTVRSSSYRYAPTSEPLHSFLQADNRVVCHNAVHG